MKVLKDETKRDASDDEVKHVARLAQCDEFVSKMLQGYDTIIGENGETLSGGNLSIGTQ